MQEIERNFDVPLETDVEVLWCLLSHTAADCKWTTLKEERFGRHFDYFDTSDFYYLTHNGTLRQVSGFAPGKSPFRYDLKAGVGDDRQEISHDSFHKFSIAEIVQAFSLQHDDLGKVASADARYVRMHLQQNESLVYMSIDHFSVVSSGQFKNIEIELKKGDVALLDALTAAIGVRTGYAPTNEQKYSRIMRILDQQ